MGVKLQSALGGSVELNAPSTASNFAMTVPAGNGTVATTDQLQNFRNKLYNGNFMVWQRGTSSTDRNAFLADRWGPIFAGTGGTTTRSRSTTDLPPDNRVKYKLTTAQSGANFTSAAAYGHRQTFEIGDIQDMFAGGLYTASFWYRSNITGTHHIRVGNQLGGGSAGGAEPITGFSYPTANFWQYTTITFTLPALTTRPTAAENTIGGIFDVGPTLGNIGPTTITSGQYFDVALVQLERGSIATTFERRPFGAELALCQRYFQRLSNIPAYGLTSSTVHAFSPLPVQMRASPTVSASGPLNYQGDGATNATQSSASFVNNSSSPTGISVVATTLSNVTTGRTLMLAIPANNGNRLTLNAEL